MSRPYFLVALGLLAPASTAFASPGYPATIASELELPCEPACTLCHTRATGGFATVNTPFGLSVRMDEGLECCDASMLPRVLDELRDKETDSDGDGDGDIAELQALTSPNTEGDVDLACDAAADDSGCSVSDAGATPRAGRAALLVAAVFFVMAAAVRRRRFA
jgi:hypothetical protein